MNVLDTPIKSISELKKEPMKVFDEARRKRTGAYILNRNKAVGVVLDTETYEAVVKKERDQEKRIEELKEKIFDMQVEITAHNRLKSERNLIPVEDALGKDWDKGLDDIPDEWE